MSNLCRLQLYCNMSSLFPLHQLCSDLGWTLHGDGLGWYFDCWLRIGDRCERESVLRLPILVAPEFRQSRSVPGPELV